jgi:hypothetical protein
MSFVPFVQSIIGLLAVATLVPVTTRTAAQAPRPAPQPLAFESRSLESVLPDTHARLVQIERAQGVIYGALARDAGRLDEADVARRVSARLSSPSDSQRSDSEAEQGWRDALGARGAAIVQRAHVLHREVLAIFASVPPRDRRNAIDAALARYAAQPSAALPDAPKDMTILYDHPYTSFVPPAAGETEPHRELRYPRLTGIIWSMHWYELALQDALDSVDDAQDRQHGLETVRARFERKLSAGTPPHAYPTELPLAPSIAPGLVALHPRAASVLDNLNMMLDVVADVLVHPGARDRRSAVDNVIGRFLRRDYRCVQTDEWITVALRHSIFEQGGPAIGTMAANERNAFFGGHGQHYAVRRAPPPCDAP